MSLAMFAEIQALKARISALEKEIAEIRISVPRETMPRENKPATLSLKKTA